MSRIILKKNDCGQAQQKECRLTYSQHDRWLLKTDQEDEVEGSREGEGELS
jgi:hypothetical protein